MSLSDPNPAIKFRSVGGQILLASFWTLLVVNITTAFYCYANEFGDFTIVPSEKHQLYFSRITHGLAEFAMDVCIIPLGVLSLAMMSIYKPFGIVGLSSLVPSLFYLAIPRF